MNPNVYRSVLDPRIRSVFDPRYMTSPILKIRLYGDPCLRKKSIPVMEVGPSERLLIQSMIETMHQAKGVGLAAPQAGINQRILVADIGQGPIAVINPQIVKKEGSVVMEEGCLSIPGVVVKIKRPRKIFLKFLDEDNRVREERFEDLMARVLLHETDHLNGRLIVDYAGLIEKRKLKKKLDGIAAGYQGIRRSGNQAKF